MKTEQKREVLFRVEMPNDSDPMSFERAHDLNREQVTLVQDLMFEVVHEVLGVVLWLVREEVSFRFEFDDQARQIRLVWLEESREIDRNAEAN